MALSTRAGISSSEYIPSLDGLRAISIALVVFGHSCGSQGFPIPLSPRIEQVARYGVQVFFVISGFLITTLLLKEQKISLRKFYFRRSLRILPAVYSYILVIAVAAFVLHWVSLAPSDVVRASLFVSNYHFANPWVVGHLWSLSTEDQFYLVCRLLLEKKKINKSSITLIDTFTITT